MKIKRQYFKNSGIRISRVGGEKIQLKVQEYRDDVMHELIIHVPACSIRVIGNQLNGIINSYETDIEDARRALRGET